MAVEVVKSHPPHPALWLNWSLVNIFSRTLSAPVALHLLVLSSLLPFLTLHLVLLHVFLHLEARTPLILSAHLTPCWLSLLTFFNHLGTHPLLISSIALTSLMSANLHPIIVFIACPNLSSMRSNAKLMICYRRAGSNPPTLLMATPSFLHAKGTCKALFCLNLYFERGLLIIVT